MVVNLNFFCTHLAVCLGHHILICDINTFQNISWPVFMSDHASIDHWWEPWAMFPYPLPMGADLWLS